MMLMSMMIMYALNSCVHGLAFISLQEHSVPALLGSTPGLPSTAPQSGQILRSNRLQLASMLPPPLPEPSTSLVPSSTGKGKQKAEYFGGDWDEAEDEDDGEDYAHDPSYQDKDDLSAKKRVQQVKAHQSSVASIGLIFLAKAWTQAVQNDTTLIVIHSGNYEVIGIRHRASQTLYISDVIEPPTCSNPAYGKLHTGIYIAAIQDT